MLKKFALIMLCALPIGLFAQEKLGHVNSQEIIRLFRGSPLDFGRSICDRLLCVFEHDFSFEIC
jgi:hypothetical protein